MEREYNVGTWITPSDEYIKDIKQALVEKGLATEETSNSECAEIVGNITPLKGYLDTIKTASSLFNNQTTIENIDDVIKFDDTENVTRMDSMFSGCTKLKTVPLLNTSKVTLMSSMFYYCSNLESVKFLDTSKVEDANGMFQNCSKLKTVEGLDLKNCKSYSSSNTAALLRSMFYNCSVLENLKIKNIRGDLTIGSGTTYGHKLTLDSLINTCKECVKYGGTLTMGSANLNKIANVYVKFTDPTQTEIASGEKGEVEVCESTDEGAMTITEYMALKNWTLA